LLAATAVALGLIVTSRANAKPLVVVKTEFGKGTTYLRKRVAGDLATLNYRNPPEQFITDQFIDAFARLGMFDFRSAVSTSSRYTVSLVVEANPDIPWPLGDVWLTLRIVDQEFKLDFCGRAACGRDRCIPRSFSDQAFYKDLFSGVLSQWPDGFLKNIPLSDQATYERGLITVPVGLAELGQLAGSPTAYFELVNQGVRRHFVFCRTRDDGRAEGRDLGTQLTASCVMRPVRSAEVPRGLGTVLLHKGILK
jgi:hypothetical protein